MKIGIITYWWSEDNYGSILQCYALQKYLRDAGYDAYLIRYDARKDETKNPNWTRLLKILNPVKLLRFLFYQKSRIIYILKKKNNPRNFDYFRNKYINQSEKTYYSYNELVNNPPEADVYIVGSDQMWNFNNLPLGKIKDKFLACFLSFGDADVKRISYAVSFGNEKLNDDFVQEISLQLKKFDYISVREKSGIDICKQCGIHNAKWVPDPTMLLDADVYRTLYKN